MGHRGLGMVSRRIGDRIHPKQLGSGVWQRPLAIQIEGQATGVLGLRLKDGDDAIGEGAF